MSEQIPDVGSPHLQTIPPETPSPKSNLFVGPYGLRPFWGLLIYLVILALPIALLIAAAHMAHAGKPPAHPEAQHQLSPVASTIAEWLQFGFVFFATWIMSRIEHRSVFDYGLQHSPRRLSWLITGALWGVLFLSLLIAILWSTHHLLFTGSLLHPATALGYGLLWAVSFLGTGFFEEFLFRGYLQFNLTRCFAGLIRAVTPGARYADAAGFWIAAVLISFGFGFAHRTNAGESPVGLLCAALAGLVFAFSLWRTGSLWWAIGLHAAWDWSQSFLYGVPDSGAVSADRLLASHPAGPILLSGGLTGPEGSVFVLPIMLLIFLVIAVTLPRDSRTSAESPWAPAQPAPAPGGTLA